MDRGEAVSWLKHHPQSVRGDPVQLCERCEKEVRAHAAEDAWRHAKAFIEEWTRQWEYAWGFHASEAFVGRELCHALAKQLARSEPELADGDEYRLAGEAVLGALGPEARRELRSWLRELAEREEHRVWREIVRFTNRRGRTLARDGTLSSDLTWDGSRNYADTAYKVGRILAHDCEEHSHITG